MRFKPSKHELFYFLTDTLAVQVMSFVGGFMDATGYLKLKGLFVTSVTGNLIVATTAAYNPRIYVLPRVLVTVCYAFAVMLSTTLTIRMRLVEEWNRRTCAIALNIIEIFIILLALLLGELYNHKIKNAMSQEDWDIVLIGCIMCASMGVHITSTREAMPHAPSTVVMTMNMVSLSINLAVFLNQWLSKHMTLRLHPRRLRAPSREVEGHFSASWDKLVASAWPLIAFIVGGIAGAVLTHFTSFWSLSVPCVLMGLLTFDIYGGKWIKTREAVPEPELDSLTREERDMLDTTDQLDQDLAQDERTMEAARDITGDNKVETSAI